MNIVSINSKTFMLMIIYSLSFFIMDMFYVYLSTIIFFKLSVFLFLSLFFIFVIVYYNKNILLIFFASLINLLFLTINYPLLGLFISNELYINSENLKFITGLRTIFFTSILTFVLFWNIKFRPISVLLLITLIFIVNNLILLDAPFKAQVIYLLNSILPFLLLPITIILLINKKNIIYIDKKILLLFLFSILIFGLLYWLSIDISYDIFRPDLVSSIRSRDGLALNYGEFPGSWGSRIDDFKYTRIPGTFADPIQWGYFLLFFTILAIFYFKSYSLLLILLFTIIMAGSKGAIMTLLGFFIFYLILKKKKILFVPIMLFWIMFILLISFLSDTSGKIHLLGLFGGITSILNASSFNLLFGFGIGSGGNMLSVANPNSFDRSSWVLTGAESGFGTYIYQTGILGLTLLLYLLKNMYSAILNSNKLNRNNKYTIVSILTSYYITFLMQENLLNTSFLGMLLLVIFLLITNKNEDRKIVYSVHSSRVKFDILKSIGNFKLIKKDPK